MTFGIYPNSEPNPTSWLRDIPRQSGYIDRFQMHFPRISVEQQSIMRTVSFRLMPPLPYSLCFFVHAFIVGWNSNWLHILNWFSTLVSFSIKPETMTVSSSSRAIFLNLPFLELVLAWSVLLLAVECSCHVPVQSITWEAGRISDPNLNPNPNTYPSLWYYDILHLIMLSVC